MGHVLECGTQLCVSKREVVQRAPLGLLKVKTCPWGNIEQLMYCPCPVAPALPAELAFHGEHVTSHFDIEILS